VRIIARSALLRIARKFEGHHDHRALKASLDAWYHEVTHAQWKNSADIKQSYANASIIGADRVVFNIRGNSYRLVVAVDFRKSAVFIKWFGTHKEYDEIDVRTVKYVPETN
jgi:mRNA interferase HigB